MRILLLPSGPIAQSLAGRVRGSTSIGAETFAYDSVYRLLEGSVGKWRQEYKYDEFGNVTEKKTTDDGGQQSTLTLTVDQASNRLAGGSYDAAGNLTQWGLATYDYDALDRMRAMDTRWTYLYDARGQRVATIDWTGSVEKRRVSYTIRNLSDQVLSRFDWVGEDVPGSWSWRGDYVYAGRLLLAFEDAGATRHFHRDHLGTPRLITDGTATTVSLHAFLPYGEEVTPAGDEAMKFTGHERDLDTGLDYLHARYYNSDLSRFSRVDPVQVEPTHVQALNRYAYALNSPMSFLDPDGRIARFMAGAIWNAWEGSGMQALAEMVSEQDPPCEGMGDVNGGDNSQWETLLEEIIAAVREDRSQPVIIGGHSLGARAAVRLAEALEEEDITVDLLLTVDAPEDFSVPSNVVLTVNVFNPEHGSNIITNPGGGQARGANVINLSSTSSHTEMDDDVAEFFAGMANYACNRYFGRPAGFPGALLRQAGLFPVFPPFFWTQQFPGISMPGGTVSVSGHVGTVFLY